MKPFTGWYCCITAQKAMKDILWATQNAERLSDD